MTRLLKQFPVRIGFLQLVVRVIALFLALVFCTDPNPAQGIGDGKLFGHDMEDYRRSEVPVPVLRVFGLISLQASEEEK